MHYTFKAVYRWCCLCLWNKYVSVITYAIEAINCLSVNSIFYLSLEVNTNITKKTQSTISFVPNTFLCLNTGNVKECLFTEHCYVCLLNKFMQQVHHASP